MNNYKNRKGIIFIFILPALLIYVSGIIFPLIQTIYFSFFKIQGIERMNFAFLNNYKELFEDKNFTNSEEQESEFTGTSQ